MRSTKIIKIYSSSLCTCLHHMVILRTRNKITDFLMILAWASPFKIYLQRLFFSPPSPVLANIHLLLASDVFCRVSLSCTCTHDVGLPTQFWFNLGPASQPIAGSAMGRQVVYDAGPTLFQHWVCCMLSSSTPANTYHSPSGFDVGPALKQHWILSRFC